MDAARLDLAEMREQLGGKRIEATDEPLGLAVKRSMLAVYSAKIAAPCGHAKARLQARCARKAKTFARRASAQTGRRGVSIFKRSSKSRSTQRQKLSREIVGPDRIHG